MNPRRPSATKPAPLCPLCGFRTSLIPNPHYGVGLATHRYLRVCKQCDWIAIVREQTTSRPAPPTTVPVEVEVEVEDVKPARVLHGFRRRGRKATAQ